MPPSSNLLQARQRRVRRIRRQVIGGASGLFAAATAAIVIQFATGHDPALAKAASRTGTTPANPATSGSGYGPPGGGHPGGGHHGGGYPGGAAPSTQPSPLTTHQS
jgi:uncharacterized membrane protein